MSPLEATKAVDAGLRRNLGVGTTNVQRDGVYATNSLYRKRTQDSFELGRVPLSGRSKRKHFAWRNG